MKTCAKDKSLFCKNKNFAKKTKNLFQPVEGKNYAGQVLLETNP